jgi:hypothetical protein
MQKIGTSNLLAGYSHIYMLNGYSFPKDKSTVFKYMPMDRFVCSVDNQELVFVSPETWYDPFEQLYFGIDCSSRGYHTEDIVCMCVSEKSSTNEDASWRVYAGSSNKSVRLSIEKDILLALLDDFASNNGYDVFIGRVNYSFEKKDIKGLHNATSPYYNVYFPTVMNREHYLSLMLLKRKAFSYENEVRIFLVKNSIKEKLLKIPCDYKGTGLVSNVMLSPYPPVRKNGDLAFDVREKINKMESDEIKTVLKEKVNCRIQQSLLYKVYPSVDKVK